ncbi:tyrosine-protein phosphatase [Litoribacter populi]|uniref:tyrosine-protein phosphatase n=1 Tax=Litoribacter populi TaxID=2598460 RepID=UPI00117F16AE|nr:CpsB/CapC family capsule biosynthesis tyrosine phosphatase [Litoribacter populi]
MSILDLILGSGTKQKEALDLSWLGVDMHSHLIPGIDDGSQSMEESINMIGRMVKLGIKKIITTPHIMTEFYKNTPGTILTGLDDLRAGLKAYDVDVEIEAAAEYYLDEIFMQKVEAGEKLLTMGGQYVLVETGFMSKPQMLLESFFAMELQGYTPIFAHPERYLYLHNDPKLLKSLMDRGVLFQANLLSFTGYYGKAVKKFAEMLVDEKQVMLLGTDAHNIKYLDALEDLTAHRYYHKLRALPLLNSSL